MCVLESLTALLGILTSPLFMPAVPINTREAGALEGRILQAKLCSIVQVHSSCGRVVEEVCLDLDDFFDELEDKTGRSDPAATSQDSFRCKGASCLPMCT